MRATNTAPKSATTKALVYPSLMIFALALVVAAAFLIGGQGYYAATVLVGTATILRIMWVWARRDDAGKSQAAS